VSDDLSHVFITSGGGTSKSPSYWGPGVYEFVGTGNEQPPRRVDVDNSGSPVTTCTYQQDSKPDYNSSAVSAFNSGDGRVAVFRVAGGCGGANPAAQAIWARIDATTSVDVSASRCTRVDCNAPADATFRGATPDGSRIFFTTTQQLLDADTDETTDLYACDIPSGTPAPVGDANPCSPLRQVSAGDPTGAIVESFGTVSDNGATALFIAKGVLADNEDALGELAVAGDHNLYVWRQDSAHPDGQTSFVARLSNSTAGGPEGEAPLSTPDGRYLVFMSAGPLLDTDTDNAYDIYRYEADTGQLTRVSTNVVGVGGNGPFDASAPTISDDGQKIAFNTTEALSAADGNDEPDVYLWTPVRVSLISAGAVGAGTGGVSLSVNAGERSGASAGYISPSGHDIYFNTRGALTPADGDNNVDIYDARIGGGFSFAPKPTCTGEDCQPKASPPPPREVVQSAQHGPPNPTPLKLCPKGKVRKKNGKCVTKRSKRHSGKRHHAKKGNRAPSHNRGGSK
jgi:hypothetical protein